MFDHRNIYRPAPMRSGNNSQTSSSSETTTLSNTAVPAALIGAIALIALAALLVCHPVSAALADEGDASAGESMRVQAPDSESPITEDEEDAYAPSESAASTSASAASASGNSASLATDDKGGFILQLVDVDIEQAKKNKVDVGYSSDDEERIEQGDARFEGIVFEVYDEEGGLAAKAKADETGLVSLKEKNYLDLGTYYLKLNEESAKKLGYTANEKWPKKGKEIEINEADAEVDAGTFRVQVIRGAVRLNRVDGELYDVAGIEDAAQGKGSLADAEYLVYNASASAVIVGGRVYEPFDEEEGVDYEQIDAQADAEDEDAETDLESAGTNVPIMEITTDELGVALTSDGLASIDEEGDGEEADELPGTYDTVTGLPWGTYLIKEKKASKGYRRDKEWSVRAEVRGAAQFDAEDVSRATVKRGGAKITMKDGETEDGKPQGDATLKGAVFEIVSDNGEGSTVVVDGKTYNDGDVVTTVTTNKKGAASCGKKVLPYGTYKIRMAKEKGTKSYAYNKKWSTSVTVKKNNKQVTPKKKKTFKAKAIRGGITVQNLDADDKEPLSDSTIEVVNESKAPVIVNGKAYAQGEAVLAIETDEDGIAASESDVLPYGTYSLRETTASDGYELNKDWHPVVKVRQANELVDAGNLVDSLSPEAPAAVEDSRPTFLTTLLPVFVIAIALILMLGGIGMAVHYRKSAREAAEAHPVAPVTDTARGMNTVTSNKTYIEAAQEAEQAVSPGKTFEQLSRDNYSDQIDSARKGGKRDR